MAVSGDSAIVGEPNGNATVGGAQIFVRSDHGWAPQAGLSDLGYPNAPGISFGSAVAIDGDTAVVADCGASITCFPMDPPTAVYVYTRVGSQWTEQAKLTPSTGTTANHYGFGESVSISGDTIAVGAGWAQWGSAVSPDPTQPNMGTPAGEVYIFQHSGDQWTQQAVLKAGDAGARMFGTTVALDGDALLVGCPCDGSGGNWCGSVYAYQRSGTTWTRSAILIPPDPMSAEFGTSLALSSGTAVIGAPDWSWMGAAYVYVLADGSWREQAELTDPTGDTAGAFGSSVAIDGDVVAVGSPGDDLGAGWQLTPWGEYEGYGSASLFRRVGTTWEYEAKLLGTTQDPGWLFGASVGVTGSTALVGSPQEIMYGPGNVLPAGVDHLRVFCLYVTDAGSSLSVSASDGLLSNFATTYSGDLSASLASAPTNGKVAVSPDGSFAYTPNAGFVGTDTFTYQTNEDGVSSDPATVTIEVRNPVTPQTDVYGASAGWTNKPVTVSLGASSNAARSFSSDLTTVYRKAVHGAAWVTYSGPIRVSAPGVSNYNYRSSDSSGDSSGDGLFTVKIDVSKPVPVILHAVSCRNGANVTLAFRIVDAKPSCGRARVTLHILDTAGKVVRRVSLGIRPTNKAQTFRFRCTLPSGSYRVALYATDVAGNRQSKVGSNRLRVL
jgi:hypothetical protein